MAVDDVNNIISNIFPVIGGAVAELDNFSDEMIVAERLAAFLVASACVRYNRKPEDVPDVFMKGFKEALDNAVYGKKQ